MTTDTKAVARWHNNHAIGNMFECVDGDYVTFTDHEQVVAELRSALAAKSAEVEGLAVDAERWRWLTSQNDWDVEPRELAEDGTTCSVTFYSPKRLDKWGELDDINEAIDAAMEKSNEHQDQ